MDSRQILKWHINIFRAYGMWRPKNKSKLYDFYVIIYSIFFNVGLPLSELVCVLFVGSVDAIVDNLVLTSSVILVVLKTFNVLVKQKIFYEVFDILKELDETITPKDHKIFVQISKRSSFWLLFFLIDFVSCWAISLFQVIVSDAKYRIWSSTYLYPAGILHHPIIYFSGVVFQGIGHFIQVTLNPAVDTYGAALIDLINGHINVLSRELNSLGYSVEEMESSQHQKLALIHICKKYASINE